MIGGLAFTGAVSVGAIVGHVIADTSQYLRGLKDAEHHTKSFATRVQMHLRHTGAAFTHLGRRATLMGAAIAGAAVYGIRQYGNFERAMREATAMSDVTAKQFQQMSLMAERASIMVNRSANETARGFYFLGTAGLTAEEQIAAFYTSVQLARAGVMEVGQSVEILVDTVMGIGYSFDETRRAADILVETFTSSNTQLEQLGESMSMVAAIAYETHTPLEEVAAALGLMANVGIKGSRAGTAMRRALVNLMDPSREMLDVLRQWNVSAYDMEGKMKPWVQLVIELSDSLAGATEEQRNHAMATLFGVRALTGQLAVFRNAGDDIAKFAQQIGNAEGALQRVTDKQMMAFMNRLGSMWQRVQMLIRHVAAAIEPEIRGLTAAINPVLDKMIAWVDLNPELAATIAKVTVAVGALTLAGGTLTMGLGALAWSLSYLIPILGTLLTTVLPIIAAIAATAVGIYALRVAWVNNFLGIRDFMTAWADWIIDKLEYVAEGFNNIINLYYAMYKGFAAGSKWGTPQNPMFWVKWGDTFFETFARKNALKEDMEALMGTETAAGIKDGITKGLGEAGDWLKDKSIEFGGLFKKQLAEDLASVGDFIAEKMPGLLKFKEIADKILNFKVPTESPFIEPPTRSNTEYTRPSYTPPIQLNWWQDSLKQWYEDTADVWPTITDLMVSKFKEATGSITDAMSDMFVSLVDNVQSLRDTLNDFVSAIRQSITRAFADMMANAIMMRTIGMMLPGGSVMPWRTGTPGVNTTGAAANAGAGLSAPSDFSFKGMSQINNANGNILRGGFKAFRSGGIATQPTLGLIGEGDLNEAIVPLPDGRRIPVEMRGGRNTTFNNLTIQAIDTQSGYAFLKQHSREIMSLMQVSSRNNHPYRRG